MTGPRQSPIERFLGPDERRGGPFGLLGVAPESCTEDAVLAGLDRQLERLAAHPECDTPEADEVRLALHAAAAQLLDSAVRRQLVAKWTGVAPAPAAPVPQAPARSGSRRPLEADAVLTLGLHGGWNERSLQHLATLAHARGMGSEQVAAALRTLAKKRRPAAARVPGPVHSRPVAHGAVHVPRRDEPLPEQIDPAGRLLWMLAIFGGGGVLLAALAVWVVVRLVTAEPTNAAPPAPPPPAPALAPVEPVTPAPAPPGASAQPTATPVATQERPPAPGEVSRALAGATATLATDAAGALAKFESEVQRLGRVWPVLPPAELVATNDAVVEFVYRAAGSGDTAVRAVAAVGKPAEALARADLTPTPDAVAPAVWSVGMLARLWHEKDLPADAKTEMEQRLAAATSGGSPVQDRAFPAGAAAALAALPRHLLPAPPEGGNAAVAAVPAWREWARAAEAWSAGDERALSRVLVGGLEVVLIDGPEPSDQRTYTLIADLVQRLTWRDGDPARARLLRWFDDPRVSGADLNAVTSTIATRSAAEGVDITMVLSAAASGRVRGDLRERYARLWGLDTGVDRVALDSEWIEKSRQAIDRSLAARTPAEHMAAAVVLSRLNESAWRRWRGDAEESMRLLTDLTGDVDAVVPPGGSPTPPAPTPESSDAGWGEKYLAVRRAVPQRLELLGRLESGGGGLGAVDAEVLVQEALLGTPAEVRVRAAGVTRLFQDSPAVVNALLEYLPRAPRIAHTGQLVEAVALVSLPSVTDPAWPAAARRALIERYLERVTAEGSLAPLDQLAHLLSASYRGRASEAVLAPALRSEAIQPPAGESARQVWTRWHAQAAASPPVSASATPLAELDRRRAGRTSLARGLVQTFAAEQVSILEVMAAAVAAEQPARAAEVEAVSSEALSARAAASTIMEQIDIVERAMVRLWVLRSPGGEPS